MKEFINYEQALELKKLKFNEPCICYYDIKDLYKLKPIPMSEEVNSFKSNTISTMVAAPLYQQTFRWFREKYDCHHTIKFNEKNEKYVGVAYFSVVNFSIDKFNTYEEAELECLKKLIKMLKGNNK